jgi:signal transduction histidine kinase
MRSCTALQVLCTSLVVWAAGALPASSATRHVVLIYDERLDLPGLAALDADLTNTLTSNSSDPIEVYREALDLSRFGSNTYRTLVRDFLRSKYENKKIDVAIAILGPALDFLLSNGDTIFPGTPIVFCGVDRKEFGDRSLPPHVRGILVKREFAPTLEIALTLHPQTKRVAVVAGSSDFDAQLLDQARNEFRVYENRLAFTYLTALPLQRIIAELSQEPPETIVLFTTFFQDSAGEAFVTHDVAQRVSAAASAPVYGFIDQYLGRGIVGGSLYSFSAHGTEAAKLASRILAGAEPSGPPMSEVQANKVVFDWRQMQRWGISESSLPPGSEIRFRDPTAWEQYRWQILAATAVLLLQAAMITGLLYEHRRRRNAEIEARQRMSELAHLNRHATAGELSASIAHELNQPLGAILNNAETGVVILNSPSPNLDEIKIILDEIRRDDHRATEVIRRLRRLLKKTAFDMQDVDLNETVSEVLKFLSMQAAERNVTLNCRPAQGMLRVSGDRVQLQQVILNLVMNGMESMAGAANGRREVISSTSLSDGASVNISIADFGPGIPSDKLKQVFEPFFTTKDDGMGMGLSIARTIVEAHGGRIWAENHTAGGAVFHVSLPLAKPH